MKPPPPKAVPTTGLKSFRETVSRAILLPNTGARVGSPQASRNVLEWVFAMNDLGHLRLFMTGIPASGKATNQEGACEKQLNCIGVFRIACGRHVSAHI